MRSSPFLSLAVLLICVSGFGGCAAVDETAGAAAYAVEGDKGRYYLDLASVPTKYVDSKIYTGEMLVTIHPNVNLEKRPTALFVPLGLTQKMRDSGAVSQGVSRQVWQQFLREETFSTLELANMDPPYRADMAVPLARSKGADMMVGGYITYYYDGGSNGDTSISLQLEIYDTRTGDLLWSVAHAGTLPYQTKRDFLLLEVESRMPADPMGAVIARVAGDMARLIHLWSDPEAIRQQRMDGAGGKGDAGWFEDSAFGRF